MLRTACGFSCPSNGAAVDMPFLSHSTAELLLEYKENANQLEPDTFMSGT